MARKSTGSSIKKAFEGIEILKKESYIDGEINYVTALNLHKRFGLSRNNFSEPYRKQYPAWEDAFSAIEDFKIEFIKLKKKKKESPLINKLKTKLKISLEQNLTLIKERGIQTNIRLIEQQKYEDLLTEKREQERVLNEYINQYGLLNLN